MKILKEGNIEKSRNPEKFVCHKCGCEYIADNTEYKIADFWAQQHDGIKAECKCPTCGVINSLSFSESKDAKWCIITINDHLPFPGEISHLTIDELFDTEQQAKKVMNAYCKKAEEIGVIDAYSRHMVLTYGEAKGFLK